MLVSAADTPQSASNPPVRPPAPILTNAADVISLSPEMAKAGFAVRLRGLVTCYDPGRVLFVQDSTAGVFVYHTGERLALQPGQSVEVKGFVKQGYHSPYVDSPTLEPLTTGPTVKPRLVSLAQIEHGGLDAQWIEVIGAVRSQKILDSRLWLELVDSPHRIHIWIPEYRGYERLQLSGSLVRIRGVVGSRVSRRGILEGFQVFCNTINDITVLQTSTADPFARPLQPIREFRNCTLRNGGHDRVRVKGVVTFCEPGYSVAIQDATGGLEVGTQLPIAALPPGTVLDVSGYPGAILGAPVIEDAEIRIVETNGPPAPVRVSAGELFEDRYPHQLVEIEAQFLGRVHTPSNTLALALQANNRLLIAQLHTPQLPKTLGTLDPGCEVRVTGVCHPHGNSGEPAAISLWLRSPEDVKVIGPATAQRATPSPLLGLVAILTSLGLVVALLSVQKHRRNNATLLREHASLQTEMRQGEQQLRRSMAERERIGRDLHDDIIQSIYAAGLGLEECRRVVRQSPQLAEAKLAAAIQSLNETISGVRSFIAGLEPKVLNGREFKTALKSLALTSGDSPIQFQFHVDPAAANNLTPSQATQLLHIAKEAMSNSLRHARASSVTFSLQPVGNGVQFEIIDDGVGFDPATAGGAGQGLRNMAARAHEMGGDLQTFSSSNHGSRIVATVPQRNTHESD